MIGACMSQTESDRVRHSQTESDRVRQLWNLYYFVVVDRVRLSQA